MSVGLGVRKERRPWPKGQEVGRCCAVDSREVKASSTRKSQKGLYSKKRLNLQTGIAEK